MNSRLLGFGLAGLLLVVGVILYAATTMPGLISNPVYLGGLLLIEIVIIGAWRYERVFFPLLVVTFLWSGAALPLRTSAMTVRWVLLVCGAWIGLILWVRTRKTNFGAFHLAALCCVALALVSALVSATPDIAALKVLSLFLLFLYGAAGARLAVRGREWSFIQGLVLGCEILAYVSAAVYLIGRLSLFGSPNSLGAVMGVVVVPVLFWDFLANQAGPLHNRRTIALVFSAYLLYMSVARAAILATVVTVLVMCVVLRRYRLLLHSGFVIVLLVAALGAANPARFDSVVSYVTSSFIYKQSDTRAVSFQRAFESRMGPWQVAFQAVKRHPWFGTGFGTSEGTRGDRVRSDIYSMAGTHREHANSYLAIVAYVGLAGIIPFAILTLLLAAKLTRIYRYVLRTRQVCQPFVPIAMVVLAGLVHAIFEDWLFAPGYYLCIIFWALAFQLMDFAPAVVVDPARWAFRPATGRLQAVPPASIADLPSGLGS